MILPSLDICDELSPVQVLVCGLLIVQALTLGEYIGFCCVGGRHTPDIFVSNIIVEGFFISCLLQFTGYVLVAYIYHIWYPVIYDDRE